MYNIQIGWFKEVEDQGYASGCILAAWQTFSSVCVRKKKSQSASISHRIKVSISWRNTWQVFLKKAMLCSCDGWPDFSYILKNIHI
jgi:hypothetical protein